MAIIRATFGGNPWTLTDEEFGIQLNEACYINRLQQQTLEAAMTNVLAKAFGKSDL